jgi:hypothetical protein
VYSNVFAVLLIYLYYRRRIGAKCHSTIDPSLSRCQQASGAPRVVDTHINGRRCRLAFSAENVQSLPPLRLHNRPIDSIVYRNVSARINLTLLSMTYLAQRSLVPGMKAQVCRETEPRKLHQFRTRCPRVSRRQQCYWRRSLEPLS